MTANLDFLRNSPQFQQLRQLVQQQPAMLEPVLQQVAEGNPQLAQMITQNQEQFLQLLSEVCFSPRFTLKPSFSALASL
jgi:UV excision repair protein RAD23